MSKLIYDEKDIAPAVFDGHIWDAAGFKDNGAERIAMRLLGQLSGMTVSQIRTVLRCVQEILDATAMHDCQATSFQQADEGYRRASGESV